MYIHIRARACKINERTAQYRHDKTDGELVDLPSPHLSTTAIYKHMISHDGESEGTISFK